MRLPIRHEIVGSADSPQRLRIAHLSDLHLWFSEHLLRSIEAAVDAWRPDVLALTGDYADTPRGRRLTVAWVERMARTYPVCWVAGNHDRWGGRGFVRRLEAVSHAHAIDRRDAWIAGKRGARFRFTSLERMNDRPQHAAEMMAPTVVLLHEPSRIAPAELEGASNRLLLAGHLHGGQITLWRDRAGRPQPATMCFKWLVDRTTIGGAHLIVSRGLGDMFPLRIGAPHEIVMVDFCAAPALARREAGTVNRAVSG